MFEQKTGKSLPEIARLVEAVVVTKGGEGSTIHTGGQQIEVPPVKPEGLVDPTGCGDAYRAGLLHGLARGWNWENAARLASVMGSIKIAHKGGQNHRPSREEIASKHRAAFGVALQGD
jgi:adenosine kinase